MQEITSNRLAIVGQSLAIIVAGVAAGWALEYFDVLDTSPLGRLSSAVGLPVVGATVCLVGLAIAIATAVDSWTFSVRVGDTGIEIVERLGTTTVRYAN